MRTSVELLIIEALLVVSGLVSTVAQAQFNYVAVGGSIIITGYAGPGGEVTVPPTINGLPVTVIGSGAFYNSVTLTGVTLPSSVTSLYSGAFSRCTRLANFTIPSGVTNIDQEVFSYCTNLTTIAVHPANAHYSSLDGVLFDKGRTLLVAYPAGKAGTYAIPNGVTNVLQFAFLGCARLTRLSLPTSMTGIGFSAFYGCNSLTNVTIPDSVTGIGGYAFSECGGLISVAIPDSVTNLELVAFYFCTNLTSVMVGQRVASIGASAFASCRKLSAVYFSGNAPAADPSAFDGDTNTVYYLPGTTGWGPTFAGRPTVLWNPKVQTSDPTFGLRTNRFGFTITGTANIPLRIDACTNFASPVWVTLQRCALTNGSLYFSDAGWTNYPRRFYRISPP